ncbi:AB hydrolase-1 domain-containing protein [Heracleum sosnowskyi]|uniref:AB hydrolase-1 domain-containing protein n=1 Tax=Heracleum sosnowskyi TaxID=360622 RepID=A0AAD8IQL4_9APIA|nr:AB hydrolase-1 domain-containing protein [Heracleum sosnowskyi]
MTTLIQSDFRTAFQFATAFRRQFSLSSFRRPPTSFRSPPSSSLHIRGRAFSTNSTSGAHKVSNKPSICTADELHYVSVNASDWRLALWRYLPAPQAPKRNHPLLLLSGVGTNAIGYDLSPESSFARHMSGQGYDTWILEVRGAGLSMEASEVQEIEKSAHEKSEQMEGVAKTATAGASVSQMKDFPKTVTAGASSASPQLTNDQSDSTVIGMCGTKEEPLVGVPTVFDESRLVTKLTEFFMNVSGRVSGFLSEEAFNETREKLSRLLESKQDSVVASQIRDLSQKLITIIEESQRTVSPPLNDLQERFISTVEELQRQLELIVKYDWDFDHYLEEDVPAAMEYIKALSKPRDGKLLAVGHSMGGILLYALLSRYGHEGRESDLAAIVTLASSLDYRSSKSSLKLLIPLAEPAQALNVPAVPLGALLTMAFPLSSRAPYVLSWLNHMISAEDMMHPKLLKKLILNNFCTIPAKLLLQLATAFKDGGLCDRSGKFFYKDHLHKSNVPVLAVAGDKDLICPIEAVHDTVKLLPKNLVTYKVFGDQEGPHYAHYDLVGGQQAVDQVYPCIAKFLSHHDG